MGVPSRRESRRGSFRVLLTPLTYIHVGDGAPTVECQHLTLSVTTIQVKLFRQLFKLEAGFDRSIVKALDTGEDLLFCGLAIFPAFDRDPLVSLEVFVVIEEM